MGAGAKGLPALPPLCPCGPKTAQEAPNAANEVGLRAGEGLEQGYVWVQKHTIILSMAAWLSCWLLVEGQGVCIMPRLAKRKAVREDACKRVLGRGQRGNCRRRTAGWLGFMTQID